MTRKMMLEELQHINYPDITSPYFLRIGNRVCQAF